MNKDAEVFVAGARGLVGSAICRGARGAATAHVLAPRRSELDLRDRPAVDRFFASERPDYVFMAAAKVGGIVANDTYPADFIRDNLADPDQRHRRGLPQRHAQVLLPGLELHLSAPRAAAAARGLPADRPARADQSVVRHRQDRRHQDVPGLRPPVRLQLRSP